MNPGQGGGDPDNDDPAQRHDHPSSSSRRLPLPEATPLQLLTSSPQFQPQGGYGYYVVNQSSSGVGIPSVGNMSGSDLRRLVAPVPVPGYLYSESGAPWPPLPNAIARQNQYQPWANQPHPSSAAVFPAPRYNPVYLPVPAVYAQQPSSSTFFFAPGYNYDSSSIPHAPIYPPWAAVYAQQPGFATAFSAPGHNNNLIPHASVNLLGAPLYAQPGAATDFSARDGNANTSAGLIAPPANSNQGATASGGPVAGVPDPLAQKNVQANVGDLATNPETSGELIFMLEQDNHEVRVLVTRWVLEDVRMVMGSHTGHAVLLALLGAVERANMIIAIEAIINGAVSYRYNGASLMEVVNVSSGYVLGSIPLPSTFAKAGSEFEV